MNITFALSLPSSSKLYSLYFSQVDSSTLSYALSLLVTQCWSHVFLNQCTGAAASSSMGPNTRFTMTILTKMSVILNAVINSITSCEAGEDQGGDESAGSGRVAGGAHGSVLMSSSMLPAFTSTLSFRNAKEALVAYMKVSAVFCCLCLCE